MSIELSFQPLAIDQWDDFVSLFGERGACGGCWCMLWRLTRKQFESQKGAGNKLAMKAIVDSGEVPGILAYHKTEAIGWCAIAPRSSYPALFRSRILQPIDNRTCWSVACLFIEKSFRKRVFQSSFCELQVNMPNRKAQNWWKVILLNPNLRKIYHLLLRGPAYPKHSFVRGLKR